MNRETASPSRLARASFKGTKGFAASAMLSDELRKEHTLHHPHQIGGVEVFRKGGQAARDETVDSDQVAGQLKQTGDGPEFDRVMTQQCVFGKGAL